ncbi:GNAT family N-acetyltransferase [Lysinibacillus endophyticus]|uniref:GNAT family N-acetyltransferase n=2 Tax=Ureibacillus endophyticus TaxID=1978490 RepID=A0A494YYQ2_9BACL|nr:GNAT family N-acetyltransferase [Lysinibacillus endophyticus]RKQ15325.1 GNAT family N-acetyltransferase [Lysinibacillus endophyticus]
MLMQRGESLKASLIEEVFSSSNWYNRLREYFPEREMKSRKHFEILFQEQAMYKLMEGPDYVVVYFEQQDYIFIDYIIVSGTSRGKGVGSIVLNELKSKGKAIILEVEPVSEEDPDSEKRVRFYEERHNFKKMNIGYERIHNITSELNKMDIFCWSQAPVSDSWVLERMQEIYLEVHAYKVEEIYGRNPQPVSEVLWLKESREKIAQ